MFYYLYQITNLMNNKIYVGVHKTKNLNDGYMGSGKVIIRAIEKHGADKFKKDILETFEDSESMYHREKEVVTDEFLLREDVYNLRRGGDGGFDFINKNIDLVKRNTNASRNGNVGNKRSLSVKTLWDEGIYSNRNISLVGCLAATVAWTGNKHSEETKQIIGNKNSISQAGDKNSQFGTMWITNGVDVKKVKKTSIIPEGWRKGRK